MNDWNTETAEWYAANFGDYPTNRLAVDYLDLKDLITIVDVGCGTGSALRHAAEKVENGNLIGIDPVPRMIEIAREQTENHPSHKPISFMIGSAENLPIVDGTADVVFAFDSIDHWKDVNQGLSEMRRIIKTGGQFVIVKDRSVPNSPEALELLEKELISSEFKIKTHLEIKEDDVTFFILTCSIN